KLIVSVDTTAVINDQPIPGLRVYNHGNGFVTVTTLDLSFAPHDIPYYYLYYNDLDCYLACNSSIKAGYNNDIVGHGGVSLPTAAFVTVDTTSLANRNVALHGIRTYTHGAGFFQVTTDDLSGAPSSGIPYNYAIFNPPNSWEELGPTGQSGSAWTIQVDPSNRLIQYVGSAWGGVWKTTNGGDTWSSAWQGQRLMGILRLAMAPNNSNVLYAGARDGTFYSTTDGGNTWFSL